MELSDFDLECKNLVDEAFVKSASLVSLLAKWKDKEAESLPMDYTDYYEVEYVQETLNELNCYIARLTYACILRDRLRPRPNSV
jgi:hypothetical protein